MIYEKDVVILLPDFYEVVAAASVRAINDPIDRHWVSAITNVHTNKGRRVLCMGVQTAVGCVWRSSSITVYVHPKLEASIELQTLKRTWKRIGVVVSDFSPQQLPVNQRFIYVEQPCAT